MLETVKYFNRDGYEVEAPGRYVICPECKGVGVTTWHVDGGGLTARDIADDPVFY